MPDGNDDGPDNNPVFHGPFNAQQVRPRDEDNALPLPGQSQVEQLSVLDGGVRVRPTPPGIQVTPATPNVISIVQMEDGNSDGSLTPTAVRPAPATRFANTNDMSIPTQVQATPPTAR